MSSATCFNLDQSKILSSGNWLKGCIVQYSIKPLPHMPILGFPIEQKKKYDVKNMDEWGYII